MTQGPKLKMLIKRYSLPEDATYKEVLRALDVQCTKSETGKLNRYSKKCQASKDLDALGAGYD